MDTIEGLPEFDKPSYFGLPENIERSSQKIISTAVISQLKILKRADVKASKFDKDVWANELGPVLNLWKKLNQVCVITFLSGYFMTDWYMLYMLAVQASCCTGEHGSL